MAQNPTYDKYEPIGGGFRAPLAADLAVNAAGSYGPKGVSLDVNGKVVQGGAGNSGYVGILVKNVPLYPNLGSVAGAVNLAVPVGAKAGDIVDVMTDGEIVGLLALVAGTTYFLDATGNLTVTGPAAGINGYRVGHTVEATRLVVRFERVQG